MTRIILALSLLLPFAAHAQQQHDYTAQAAASTASDLMIALISVRADVASCKADLAKLRQETTAKPETK